jgi:hypothetical protein
MGIHPANILHVYVESMEDLPGVGTSLSHAQHYVISRGIINDKTALNTIFW